MGLEKLSDEDMVNFQRINLLDSTAPNPSVETLLHAFLPHKFVDHTHSTAVLALTDQPDGEDIARETFGTRMAYVPYTIPGFALAKSVAGIYDANPKVQGLILLAPRHLHLRRRCAHRLRADDRDGHARRGAYKTREEDDCAGAIAAAACQRRRDRANPARRGRARKQSSRRHRQAPDPLLPHECEDPELCERRGARALQPDRRGDARSHHPHQELAADRARARSRQTGPMGRLVAPGSGCVRRALSRIFRAQQCAAERRQEGARSLPARGTGAGRRPVRPRRLRRRTRPSPPTSPKTRSRW